MRRMAAHVLVGVVAAFCLQARAARACGGGGVSSQSSAVVANAQRILMSVRGSTTDIVVQIGVPATSADYGVLIPADSEPTLDPRPVAEADLAALDAATAPKIIVRQEVESSQGCGCLGDVPASFRRVGGAAPDAGGVSVSAPVGIGPVEAVVLTGDTGEAVTSWLAANDFALTTDGQSIVASYAGTGRYFIAIRRSDAAATGGPTSIGVHYTLQGAHQKLSLGFARLGAAPTVAFTLFNATAGRSGPLSPYASLLLTDLDHANLRAGRYADAVAAAVAAHGNKAFVLEAEANKSRLAAGQVGAGLLGLIDDDATVVRMSTIVAGNTLAGDAFFGAYADGTIPDAVYVQNETPVVFFASMGLVPALALVVFRRRRSSGDQP